MCRSTWKSAEKQHFHAPMGETKAQLAAVFINSELISFKKLFLINRVSFPNNPFVVLFCNEQLFFFFIQTAHQGKKDAEEKTHTPGTED